MRHIARPLAPAGGKRIALIEAKASRTVHPAQAAPLLRLAAAMKGYDTRSLLVHRSGRDPAVAALKDGRLSISAVSFREIALLVVKGRLRAVTPPRPSPIEPRLPRPTNACSNGNTP